MRHSSLQMNFLKVFEFKLSKNYALRHINLKCEYFSVDESKLTLRKSQQNDALAEITDEAGAICTNIHRIYRNIGRYIHFITENPLSKFVPRTETFNGKTYQEYEQEYMMYYKMIQKADGLKYI